MNIILISPSEISQGTCTLTDARAEHLKTFLHVEPGRTFNLGVVDGMLGEGLVTAVDATSVTFSVSCHTPSLAPWYDMILALPRPRSLQRILFQAAAMGVRKVFLTGAQKVEKSYFSMHLLRPEEMRPVLLDGLMQGKSTQLPEVVIIKQLRQLWELLPEATAGRWIANPSNEPQPHISLATGIPLIAIGPDGGWTEAETQAFLDHGFSSITLGARPLRTDTAAIALPAYLLGANR